MGGAILGLQAFGVHNKVAFTICGTIQAVRQIVTWHRQEMLQTGFKCSSLVLELQTAVLLRWSSRESTFWTNRAASIWCRRAKNLRKVQKVHQKLQPNRCEQHVTLSWSWVLFLVIQDSYLLLHTKIRHSFASKLDFWACSGGSGWLGRGRLVFRVVLPF